MYCKCIFVRGDGKTVFIVGSVDANSASVVLAHECYAIAGLLRGIMKILKSDSVVSICEAFFTVRESIPGQYIDPGDVVPSIEDILQQMDSLAQLGENVSEAESLRVQAESERVEAEQKRDEAVAQIVQNAESGVYDGATFTPAVSAEGVISWTNDKGLANPQSVNIKGADGLSVELQQDGEYLQWRQSEGAWQNLVELSAITGRPGRMGQARPSPLVRLYERKPPARQARLLQGPIRLMCLISCCPKATRVRQALPAKRARLARMAFRPPWM